MRYKAHLVDQGFSNRPGIDYEEMSFVVNENLEMHIMDVVTAYLYVSLDTNIYMRILDGFKIPEIFLYAHVFS